MVSFQPGFPSNRISEDMTSTTNGAQSSGNGVATLMAAETISTGVASTQAEPLSSKTVTSLQKKTVDYGPKQYAPNADLSNSTNVKAQEVVEELKINFGIASTQPVTRAEESENNQILRQKITDLMRLKHRLATDGDSGLASKKMAQGAVSFSFPQDSSDAVEITISGSLNVETYIKIAQSLLKSEWKKENHLHAKHFDALNKESNSKNCVRCHTAKEAWKQFLISLQVGPTEPKHEGFVYAFAEGIKPLKGYLQKGKTLEAFEMLTEKLGVPKEELFVAYYGLKETTDTKEHFIKSCEFMTFDHKDEARREAVALKVLEGALKEIRDKGSSYWIIQELLGKTTVLETLRAAIGKEACKKISAEISPKEIPDEQLTVSVQTNWETIIRKNGGFAHLLPLLSDNLKKALFNTLYCLRGLTGEIDDVQDAFLENPTDPLVFKAISILIENGKLVLPSKRVKEAKSFCQKVTQETLSEEFSKLTSDTQHKIMLAAWVKSGSSSNVASFSNEYKDHLNNDDIVRILKILI